jgi:hypothetical protein
LTDVVPSGNPFARTQQFLGDLPVAKPGAILDTYIAKAVEPVVAIDENDSSVSHLEGPKNEKPRRVEDQTPGGLMDHAP